MRSRRSITINPGKVDAIPNEHVIRERAAAYDEIYAHWHAKRITRELFETWNRFYLDAPAGLGNLNGDEIMFALGLIGPDRLKDRTVLDYCCGTGVSTIYLALCGARVHGFDASRQAIETAWRSAELSGVQDRVCFSVQDAQHLCYPDASFDAVFCQSALHIIIDYPRCAQQLARVLKPDGVAIFCEEALGHNVLLEPVRWLRRRKYQRCGGRTLQYDDLYGFGESFGRTIIHHFNLLSQVKMLLGERARHPTAKRLLRPLYRLDQKLIARLPWIRRFCGKVVVEYRRAGQTSLRGSRS